LVRKTLVRLRSSFIYGYSALVWQHVVDLHVHAKAWLELLWDGLAIGSKPLGSGIGLTDTTQKLKDNEYGSMSRNAAVLLNALRFQKALYWGDRVYGLMGTTDLKMSKDGDESDFRLKITAD